MKITNASIETLGPSGAAGAGSAGAVGTGHSSRVDGAKVGSSDSVSLSGASQLVNLAKANFSSGRADKVASVAALVRSGQYSADNASVSHAVVQGHIQ